MRNKKLNLKDWAGRWDFSVSAHLPNTFREAMGVGDLCSECALWTWHMHLLPHPPPPHTPTQSPLLQFIWVLSVQQDADKTAWFQLVSHTQHASYWRKSLRLKVFPHEVFPHFLVNRNSLNLVNGLFTPGSVAAGNHSCTAHESFLWGWTLTVSIRLNASVLHNNQLGNVPIMSFLIKL